MSDNEVKIGITANADGVAPGVNTAKAAVEGLGSSVASSSAKMRESFVTVSESVQEMGVRIRETVVVAGEMREAVMAFGEAMLAAFAIERIAEWSEQMGEAAEKVKHTGEIFGMTTPEVQGLQGAAVQAGLGLDTLTKGMGILDKNMVAAARGTGPATQAFKAVGVSANDGKTQMQTLLVIADKFQGMEDGPKKVALAMALLGRAGKEMIPFLNMGAEGIQKLDATNQEYSAGVMFASAANKELREWLDQVNERGMALAESGNQMKVAMQGVGNVMTDAFAPVLQQATDGINELIKAFISSYREGGVVATVLTAISGVFQIVIEVIKAVCEIVSVMWDTWRETMTSIAEAVGITFGKDTPSAMQVTQAVINDLIDIVVLLKDGFLIGMAIIAGNVQITAAAVKMDCQIMEDALHFNWTAIKSDWQNGLNEMVKAAQAAAKKISDAMAEAKKAAVAFGNDQNVNAKGGAGSPEPKGAKDFDPDLTKAPKAKKPKADKSRMSEWQQDIEDQKTAFAVQQQQQGTFEQWSVQSDVDYWAKLLARADLSNRERMSVEEKWLAALKGSSEQKLADIETEAKKELDAAGKNHDARIAILQQEAAQVAQLYGAQSKQYESVQHEITEETKAATEQRRQIEDVAAREKIKLAQMDLQAQDAAAKSRVEAGEETKGKMLAQEQQYLTQSHALDMQALALEETAAGSDPVRLAQVNAQKLEMEKQYQTQLTEIQRAASLQRQQFQRTMINSLTTDFGSSMTKMLEGQVSFTQGIQQMWRSMIGSIISSIVQMVEQWIERQMIALVLGKTQSTISSLDQIKNNAGVAWSAAYAATAAIPVIGPELAPAAASASAAGAMSGASFMAERGWGDVPHDGALTELHKQEMVLPADIASPLRSSLRSGGGTGGSSQAGGTSGGGDVHLHYNPTVHGQLPFADQLSQHEGHIIGMVKKAARSGVLKAA